MIHHRAIITLLLVSQLLAVMSLSSSFDPGQQDSSSQTTAIRNQLASNCLSPTVSDQSVTTFLPSSNSATLTGTVLPKVRNGTAVRKLQQISQTLAIHMQFVFKIRNPDQFAKCYASIMDPRSPDYGHFLNETTLKPYIPTPGQRSSVIAYLRSKGFTVTDSASPLALELSAPTNVVQRAFGITLSFYELNNSTFYATGSDPVLPQNIASLTIGILGLDNSTAVKNLSHPASLFRQCWGANAPFPFSPSPYCAPALQAGYSVSSLINGNPKYDGSGQKVAIVIAQDEPDPQTAINTFDSEFGLPATTLTILCISSTGLVTCPSIQSSQYGGEGDMDMESVHTTAPGAQILIVHPVDGASGIDAINYIASNHIAAIVTNSWNFCANPQCTLLEDSDFTAGSRNPIDSFLAADAIQGLTILFSSGDDGAQPDGSSGFPGVMFPASDPNVLAVGGTDLTLTGCGINTCTGYGSEDGWSGSGGGYSTVEPQPSWQTAAIGTSSGRAVPDVSMLGGSPGVWVYSTASQHPLPAGACGTSSGTAGWFGCAGTSLSSPLWAGFLAVALQMRSGRPFGNIAPYIYAIGASSQYSSAFHDITSGNNGYSAVSGWDPVTGWGSPIGNQLATILAGILVSTDKSAYSHGDTIQYTGTGLNPSDSFLACLSIDNDGNLLCTGAPSPDSQGRITGTMFISPTNIPVGQQKFLLYDYTTSQFSNPVQLTIRLPLFQVVFYQSGIPSAITWGVTVGGTDYTGSGSSIIVSGLSGTITYQYDSPVPGATGVQYLCASGCAGTVSGAATETANFNTQYQATQVVTSTGTTTVTSYTTTTYTSFTSTSISTSTIPTVTTLVLVPLTTTSTTQSTQLLTSITIATVTSYTSTFTSTSVIPTVTTIVQVPSTATTTAQSTQLLTSTATATATSYTSTFSSTSTILTVTTVTVSPPTTTSTIQTTQVLTSTGTTTVTSYTTTTSTSYTNTTTSTSTGVIYTTVTKTGTSAGASSSSTFLGFLSLLAFSRSHNHGWESTQVSKVTITSAQGSVVRLST